MKKKYWITGISLSALILAGTTISAFASNDGYDLFKEAMKNSHKVKNASVSIEASMKDNGQLIQGMKMTTDYNLNDKLGKGNVIVETPTESMNFNLFYQDNDFMIKNDAQEKYFVVQGSELTEAEQREKFESHHNPELLSLAEKVFDTLTIQTHDDFVITEENGLQTITADLTSEEIPSLIQEGSEYMLKKMLSTHANATMESSKYPFLSGNISVKMPVLVDNFELEHVKVVTNLTADKLIDDQKVYVKFSGTDKDGEKHVLESVMNMDYSNINNTSIQPITVDPSETTTLDKSLFKHGHK
jgi:hypothetical protein